VHKPYKWILRGLSILLLVSLIGLMIIMIFTYEALPDAKDVRNLDLVRLENGVYILEPDNYEANIVIYQGGLVQTESYLILAYLLQEEGFRVFLPKMPLNLAILNRDVISEIKEDHPSALEWIGIGHSLGGASLSFVADQLDALIFLGSYPASSQDLSGFDIRVLSITAEFDNVLNHDNYNDTKTLLPSETVFIEIKGGNHANFGYYGNQRGDGQATISRDVQHEETVDLIKDFIRE
jgi:hypothetical protein